MASGKCGKYLTWTLGLFTLTISGKGNMDSYSNENRPPWYEARKRIRKIFIEDGVTYIGRRAFSGCINLRTIDISDSVKRIGGRAFKSCRSLTSVKLPPHLKIAKEIFSGCVSLEEIHYPKDADIDLNNLSYGNNAELIPYDEFPPDITEKEPDKPKDAVEKISPPRRRSFQSRQQPNN